MAVRRLTNFVSPGSARAGSWEKLQKIPEDAIRPTLRRVTAPSRTSTNDGERAGRARQTDQTGRGAD